MKLNFKNVFLSVGMLVFALSLFGLPGQVQAANSCAYNGTSGDWFSALNWNACGGTYPQVADSVTIPSGSVVTMSGDAHVASISISNPAASSNGITLSGHTLAVDGNVTIVGSAGAGSSVITVGTGTLSVTGTLAITAGAGAGASTVSVAGGALSAGAINITGTASGVSSLTLAAGAITSNGDITFAGATQASNVLTLSSTGTLTLGGTTSTIAGTAATITINPASTVAFTGTGAQNVPANATVTSYGNLTINKTVGQAATLVGATTVAGALTVTSGTLATNTQTFTVGLTTGILTNGTISFTTGGKTFTGTTVTNAGTWSGSSTHTVAFAGDLVNTGSFTAGTGLYTFSKSGGAISGAGTITIPSVNITGNTTNSGTLTCATLLEVADGITLTNNGTITSTVALSDTGTTGAFVQGATGILNLNGVIDISSLRASTAGNTVNYTGGAQTVFDPNAGTAHTYSNLGLSGTGIKAATAQNLLVGQNLTIASGTTLSLATAKTNTANKLYFGTTSLQRSGTWGSNGSSPAATHKSDTYFTAAADGLITVATGSSSSSTTTTTGTLSYAPSGYVVTPVTCTLPQVLNSSTNTCVTPVTPPVTPDGTLCPNGKTMISNCQLPPTASQVAVAHVTYNFGTKTLKNGSRGEAVMELQRFLNAKLALGLVVDGKLGPKTIAVIKKWQLANGLVADGLIGPKTKAKMNAEVD